MNDGRTYEQVRRPFTETELTKMHEELVTQVGVVKTMRAEKTSMTSTLGASIKSTERIVFDLQERLANGYEMVETEVFFAFDEPEAGKKKVVVAATGVVLRIEEMTLTERQRSFGFDSQKD